MEKQKSSYWKFTGVFIALVVLGTGVFLFSVWLQWRSAHPSATPPTPTAPKPDEIVISKLPNGDQLVENRTWGYKFTVDKDFKVQPPSSPADKGVNVLTPKDVGCSIYFNRVNNQKNLMPIDYFKAAYSDLTESYRATSTFVRGVNATIISAESGEGGYSELIYLPFGTTLYEVVAYSDKPLNQMCVANLFRMIESSSFN